MYQVIEKRDSYGNYYEVQMVNSSGVVMNMRRVQYRQYMAEADGIPVLMIYSDSMEPVSEAIRFLNFDELARKSRNYAALAANALRCLFSYLDVYDVDLRKMTKSEGNSYVDFLLGISRKGALYETHLVTHRKSETVNSYINVARMFVTFLGCDGHILLKKHAVSRRGTLDDNEVRIMDDAYDVKAKGAPEKAEVPAYISLDEYRKILLACKASEQPACNRIIIRLIYEHGLRLGEVLGLTLEDVVGFEGRDGLPHYKVCLRNRASDTLGQSCKSLMKIHAPEDYKAKGYRMKGVGYYPVIIGDNLADELIDYMNLAHDDSFCQTSGAKRFFKRRDAFAKADSVPGGNPDIRKNFYIFLNTVGRPLTESVFGRRLRKIYEACGIPVDHGTRKNNCSHRLRHGFAMLLTNVLHIDDFDVKEFMRHKSLKSTAIYHKPTAEDVARMQEELIPKLETVLLADDGRDSS